MSDHEGMNAMDVQRQMVMQLLGSISGEITKPVKTTIENHLIDEHKDEMEHEDEKEHEDDKEYEDEKDLTENDNNTSSYDSEEEEMETTSVDVAETDDGSIPEDIPKQVQSSKESLEEMLQRAQQFSQSKINYSQQISCTETSTKSSSIEPLDFSSPKLIADYREYFEGDNNFTKGCKWSPDGKYLLSLGNDKTFRLFDFGSHVQDKHSSISLNHAESPKYLREGELPYDYQWYPGMQADDPSTCCFVSACRGIPIHLWNITTGKITHSYRPFNHLDEIAPSYSLGFSNDGSLLMCGFKKTIRYFPVERPGRVSTTICAKTQNGVISCFNFHPHLHHLFAAGSYLGNIG